MPTCRFSGIKAVAIEGQRRQAVDLSGSAFDEDRTTTSLVDGPGLHALDCQTGDGVAAVEAGNETVGAVDAGGEIDVVAGRQRGLIAERPRERRIDDGVFGDAAVDWMTSVPGAVVPTVF